MSDITDLQAKFDDMAQTAQKAFADASAKLDKLVGQIGNNPDPTELANLKADVSSTSDALKAAAQALDTKSTT